MEVDLQDHRFHLKSINNAGVWALRRRLKVDLQDHSGSHLSGAFIHRTGRMWALRSQHTHICFGRIRSISVGEWFGGLTIGYTGRSWHFGLPLQCGCPNFEE